MTNRSPYLGNETTIDCDNCGHDLLDHTSKDGCAGHECPCRITFTKTEARKIAAKAGA